MTGGSPDLRVLALARTAKDAGNTRDVLTRAGLACEVCRDMDALCGEIARGVGALILNEESLLGTEAAALQALVREQPVWSDLPFIVLTRGGPDSPAALNAMQTLGNVVILERPVRVSTFATAARTAIRARERQYQMRGYLAELEASDTRKNEFLAMLAHELRNPLAPIRSAMHILGRSGTAAAAGRKDAGSAGIDRAREIVDRQVSHLSRLVDDLLDVARITRGTVGLQRERLQAGELIARAVETSRPLLDAKRQTLTLELAEGTQHIEGDATRLVQALSNLLNNASKYTREGGHVVLGSRRAGDSVEIRIRDDGIGIPGHMLEAIFQLFTQVDTSLDRSQGGLGIGLTLARRIVEMHGGTITASSGGSGKGSCFTLSLPLVVERRASARHAEALPLPGSAVPCRIMVVDDNEDAAATLEILLRDAGYEVSTADSGPGALELYEEFSPRAVVLDIGLPGMDGYEVARRIRGRSGTRPFLLALSGYGREEDRRRAREAGFDHCLTKPADFDALQSLLASSLRAPGGAANECR